MEKINVIEVNRRVANNSDQGIGCGCCAVTAINAEIEVIDNGNTLFLSAQWVDVCQDDVFFSVTRESMFELYTTDDVTDDVIMELDRIRDAELECDMQSEYPEQYQALIDLVNAELKVIGIDDIEFAAE